MPLKTIDVAQLLGKRITTLRSLIQSRKIPAPQKDSSGTFVWSTEDIARAREALATDRRKTRHARPESEVTA